MDTGKREVNERETRKSCTGRKQGYCERVQILTHNFCDDCRWWQGDILWLLSWPRHKPNIKELFAEIVFLLRLPAVPLNVLSLSPSFTFCSYRQGWWVYTLWCSSVECQPQKSSLKVSSPSSAFFLLSLGDIWRIGWGLQAALWQLQTRLG